MVDRSAAPEVTESVSVPEGRPARVQVHEWTVEVLAGPDKGRKVKTLEGLVRVGSDPTNDLVLTDPTVSRRHLEVERTPRGLLLRDLGSRNGSWVEGRSILQGYLQPGDKVILGKTRLAVKLEARGTEVELAGAESFGDLYGASDQMRALFSELRRVAREDMNLLIEGETGTGKELAARAVHAHSARRHGAFTVVDCSVLTEANVERELALETATGGTVFFDEVGELLPTIQPRFLRLLEAKALDVRIVASTNKNLEEEVRAGRFRADLFFRLAVARARIPPLRTRKADIPLLARAILRSVGTPFELSAQTLSLFEGYDWPGNVRELRNVIERGALMQETGSANWLDFLATPGRQKGETTTKSASELAATLPYHEAKDRVLSDFERVYFAEVMKSSGFDIKIAESKTGLSMQSLYRLLKKNGLRLKDLKNAEGLS
jgi:two-component system, NtrC family, response regulator GlrR